MRNNPDAAKLLYESFSSDFAVGHHTTTRHIADWAISDGLAPASSLRYFSRSLDRLAAQDPKLCEEVSAYSNALRDCSRLGIEHPLRFSPKALVEIVSNRNAVSHDSRPLAVAIFGRQDPGGAFTGNNDLTSLSTAGYRVMYYEAGTDVELCESILAATNSGTRPADILMLAGHGTNKVMNLGDRDNSGKLNNTNANKYLDVGDASLLNWSGVNTCLKPGGHLVLKSCSNAKGGVAPVDALKLAKTFGIDRPYGKEADYDNMINAMRVAFPQAHVWAPSEDVMVPITKVELDNGRKFRRIVFRGLKDNNDVTCHAVPLENTDTKPLTFPGLLSPNWQSNCFFWKPDARTNSYSASFPGIFRPAPNSLLKLASSNF